MTERLLEVSRDKYIKGTEIVRTCIDLDKVTMFKDSERYKDNVVVWVGDSEPLGLDMSYDEFKGRLKAYHDSKLPTINTPSQWTDPTVNVKSTLTTTSTGEWTEVPDGTPSK
jgi:hypothetical protein